MTTETKPGRPSDDVWSAPESGTVRDITSGNQQAQRQDSDDPGLSTRKKDDDRGNTRKSQQDRGE